MNTLEKLAKRIGEIGDEIKSLKSKREVNLQKCHGSIDDYFSHYWNREFEDGNHDLVNCLMASYEWEKEGRSHGEFNSFDEIISMYGCKNCKAAYKAKQDIGKLKQERGRIVGMISRIGKKIT